MSKFVYRNRLKNEERHTRENISTKQMYRIGLICGSTLKGTLYDKRIIKAISSGNPVYLLARDMSLFWEFLKDQHKNIVPVYNVNRKTSIKTKELSINSQVQLNRKGLVIDTGFGGSCVDPIINRSGKYHNKKTERYETKLKGFLLSAGHRGKYDCIRTEQESQTYRNVIVDLEHSPKREVSTEESTYSSLEKNTQFIAFRLGFFAGLMNLNKSMNRTILKTDMLRKKIEQRRDDFHDINHNLYYAMSKLDTIAECGFCYVFETQWDESITDYVYVPVKKINHDDYRYHRSEIKGIRFKGYVTSLDIAQKMCNLLNKIRTKEFNTQWNNHCSIERNIARNIEQAQIYQDRAIEARKKLEELKAIKAVKES